VFCTIICCNEVILNQVFVFCIKTDTYSLSYQGVIVFLPEKWYNFLIKRRLLLHEKPHFTILFV
jgi:hypothetical protein